MGNADGGRRWREWGLVAAVLVPLAVILALPPIPQDLNLHELADRRAWLGIPNFMDVASNLAFLLFGAVGLVLLVGGKVEGAVRSWAAFFGGAVLVFFGSVYYHWEPNNQRLIWDRVPIMITFMGLFAALVSEHVDERLEDALLWPALAIGASTVFWWAHTDDLRSYIWAQAAPMVASVYLLVAYPGRYTQRAWLAWALGAYVAAKVLEFQDHEFFAVTGGAMSGHTLKHLLAALGILFVHLMLRGRRVEERSRRCSRDANPGDAHSGRRD